MTYDPRFPPHRDRTRAPAPAPQPCWKQWVCLLGALAMVAACLVCTVGSLVSWARLILAVPDSAAAGWWQALGWTAGMLGSEWIGKRLVDWADQ